ncbi:MAG: DUF488 domain-containing protein [candidate division WS1 bacterium]|nr:DUF488 domain-containing protein [candidate division WS1 bacterium]
MQVHLKRAYEPASEDDGLRVLVDRLWPRGLRKQDAHLDLWLQEVAPSSSLRKWFAHDPAKWEEFQRRYFDELRAQVEAVAQLRRLAEDQQVTLVYAARDEQHTHAAVLKRFLEQEPAGPQSKP